MYYYIEKYEQEQDERNSFLPSIRILLKRRGISKIENARFINEVVKDFYEKPELFLDKENEPKIKLRTIMKKLKIQKEVIKSYCEPFIKKKYIKLETMDGKRVTEKTILNSFIVFREEGKKELLNLEKRDLESGLDDFIDEYIKKDYYILDKNRKYLKDDYLKASNTMTDIFKQVEDRLRKQYEDEFNKYKEETKKIKCLKEDELEKAIDDMSYSFFVFLKSIGKFKTKYIDGDEVRIAYSLKMNEEEIDRYINQTIESLLATERDFFVSRTSIKLASILKNRDFEAEGSVTSSATYTIEFKLSDGAKFTAKGSIVGAVSCCGKYFHRYPINFSNAWFSDGTFMPNPSHYRLVAKL